ncbi:hypothetical protein, partial [Adonisia turfae]|uniref:hypothetical protein n=1 Tax=Adonisia turfae TaxID=2950184 RepID=UPI002029A944
LIGTTQTTERLDIGAFEDVSVNTTQATQVFSDEVSNQDAFSGSTWRVDGLTAASIFDIKATGFFDLINNSNRFPTNAAGVLTQPTPYFGGTSTGEIVAASGATLGNGVPFGALLLGNRDIGFVPIFAPTSENGFGSSEPPTTLATQVTWGELFPDLATPFTGELEWRVNDTSPGDNPNAATMLVEVSMPTETLVLDDIWVVADDDGTGRGFVNECDEENNIYHANLVEPSEIRGTKFLDLDADGDRNLDQRQELINLSSRAFYNSSLGDLYPGDPNDPLATYFPGPNRSTDDPTASFLQAPDLSDISNLGNWLDNPEATIENSEFWAEVQPVPDTWNVNDETAIIYEIDAGERSITNLIGDFGVDNGIHVWLDGNYLFGAMRGGPAAPGEYQIGPIDLSPGKHYLQVLREDHDGDTGYEVSITGDDLVEPGLEDWVIYIDANDNGQRDTNELFTATNKEGNYAFTGLESGTYIIREENQTGYVQTSPNDFKHVVTVVDGDIIQGIDFGDFKGVIPNAEPEFISTPSTIGAVNQLFRYDADAQDANRDLLTYDLSLAPEGMGVDPTRGIVIWRVI